eukprot:CAMPEP_0116127834 /NCGR_PEP_ID=MMETSP0329-20121206/7043_1 /TAXON_ID=697910 /ORGANISM="Pseudo-nitzschia arenysensis, Strain B593" /LENGTH=1048 /DNA_ID=CAMNT_0003621943 /DNA_START=256 /DNA_END=3405 /DNA_ORIENTATION=+
MEKESTDVGVDLGNGEKAVVGDAPIENPDYEGSATEGFENETQACKGTYPADCYSFMALHGPFEAPRFFFFGFLVWVFQVTFLILLVLRVAHPTLSTNENDDNPDEDDTGGFAFAKFVPSNNNTLSRWTQYMALLSYCFFADASVKDVVTAVETFPRFSRAKPGDKVWLIVLSCVLRLFQGLLSTIVVFLLVVNTSDVIDIILNFTAVNFVSDFDDIAFELCQWGKYGPSLKVEADRIVTLPAPACIYRKYQHVRYRWTVVPIAFVLLIGLFVISMNQSSLNDWLTVNLRIQFKDDPLRYGFNGCYRFTERIDKRVIFESYKANKEQAKIGYCSEKRKWFLFTGDETNACNLTKEEEWAISSKTYAFDIATVFEETWYSPTGTPLELYFFDDKKNNLDDDECGAFIGDGTCNDLFLNIIDHNYDDGDCCATTCNSLECGSTNKLTAAFNTNVTSGNGYQHCIDPQMKPVTFKIDNIHFPVAAATNNVNYANQNPFADLDPIDPPLSVICEGKNVLSVNINEEMELQTETILVPDGAKCGVSIKNVTAGLRRLPYVNYTVFHGDEKSIETDPIVIFQADSFEENFKSFERIPDCFFEKLDGHVERSTMYTGDDISNQAIQWLLEDSSGFSNCEDNQFLERYALAAINFAAPKQVKEENNSSDSSAELWIDESGQCDWIFVECVDGSVIELDLGSGVTNARLSGTIATEIGLLTNLSWLNMRANKLSGSVPSEIGEWKTMSYFGIELNELTGTIPTEIGNMASLTYFGLVGNDMNGTIPSQVFKLPFLSTLSIAANNLSGSIPEEIGMASSLELIIIEDNDLTGTLPTEIGRLTSLKAMYIYGNGFTGTIPTEIAALPTLELLRVEYNALTGSIPTELLSLYVFSYYDNKFSNLTAVDGEIICSDGGSETYCDCGFNCAFFPQNCGCKEAQSCCSALLEPFTNCEVCPFGLENPYEILQDYVMVCGQMAGVIYDDVFQFGDEEKCETLAKPFFTGIGCRCKPDPFVDKVGNSTIANSTTGLLSKDANSTSTNSKITDSTVQDQKNSSLIV